MADDVVTPDYTSYAPLGFNTASFAAVCTPTNSVYFKTNELTSLWHTSYFATMHSKYIQAQNAVLISQQKEIAKEAVFTNELLLMLVGLGLWQVISGAVHKTHLFH